MISKFKLKFGRVPNVEGEEIKATPVTVFVGPNNSGKSKVLSEIERYCRSGQMDKNMLILEQILFEGLSNANATKVIEHLKQLPNQGETELIDHLFIGSRYGRQQIPYESLISSIESPHANLNQFCTWFLTHKTLLLNGQSRINLVGQQTAGNLQHSPQSSFQVLFRDDKKREEVRRIIYEAFNSYFVIDPTNLGQLQIRLSNRAPNDYMEERGIHAEAVDFHSKAQLIDYASDGVKAFSGIITEVIAGDPQIILIDEPEAFLHPSLASKLGNEISKAASSEDKRVFISTHSPNFVMGCIQSGAPINIIRLTYRDGIATSRVLPSADILELMRNPLLRSTGVLSGLFYEFVIVTEADSDRAFYQEINERLLRFKPEWGIPNCLFINAQNKQTIPTIIRPLRQLGIPAVGIVDIDILKEGGSVWTNLLSSINVPDISHNSLAIERSAIKKAMDDTKLNMKKSGGIDILDKDNKEAAENLLNKLAEYGSFVVKKGELESWLPNTDISNKHGSEWLVKVFEKMGEDTESPEYTKPTEGDVWKFLFDIKKWLINPMRKGIPT